MKTRLTLVAAVVGAALSCTLSACVVTPARPVYVQGPVVAIPPPPPRVEYLGPPPAVGYVWIGGYWGWEGGHHVWIGGHWAAPHPGYRWVPRTWVHVEGGWRLSDGHWDRR